MPLGVDDGDRQHDDAHDLVQQRQRQRRLMEQRHDADAGLQGDGAGQRQRAVEDRPAPPRADDIDEMKRRRDPERIGHHAVIELHRERVLEQIAPRRLSNHSRSADGISAPSICGQVLKTRPASRPATSAPR